MRTVADDDGSRIEHFLSTEGMWKKGQPARVAAITGFGIEQVDGPEVFHSESAAAQAAEEDATSMGGVPLAQEATQPPVVAEGRPQVPETLPLSPTAHQEATEKEAKQTPRQKVKVSLKDQKILISRYELAQDKGTEGAAYAALLDIRKHAEANDIAEPEWVDNLIKIHEAAQRRAGIEPETIPLSPTAYEEERARQQAEIPTASSLPPQAPEPPGALPPQAAQPQAPQAALQPFEESIYQEANQRIGELRSWYNQLKPSDKEAYRNGDLEPPIDLSGIRNVYIEAAVRSGWWDEGEALAGNLEDLRHDEAHNRTLPPSLHDEELSQAVRLTERRINELQAGSTREATQPPAPEAPPEIVYFDERLGNELIRARLQRMAGEAGWRERGGFLIRDFDGNVTGRTKWIPHADWYGELPERLNPEATERAVTKALNGEKLSAKEKRVLSYMLDYASGRDEELSQAVSEVAENLTALLTDEEIQSLGLTSHEGYLTDEELDRIFGPSAQPTQRAVTGDAQGANAEGARAGRAGSTQETGTARSGQDEGVEEPWGLDLGYTPSEVEAREKAKTQAAKEEEEARRKAEALEKYGNEPLILAGSDRDADQMMALGQGDVFAEGERRQDTARRKSVSELSPEEMRRELLIDPLTGLGNRRAYDEAEKLPIQVSIDIDALKWINDNMSHESGDALLRAVGEALGRVAEKAGEAFHISGDEFIIQTQTRAKAQWMMEGVERLLKEAVITAELPDGTTITKTGLGFSYGIGKTLQDAEAGLREHKAERERQGLRAPRGGEPRGVDRTAPQREQDSEHQAPETDVASSEQEEAVESTHTTPAETAPVRAAIEQLGGDYSLLNREYPDRVYRYSGVVLRFVKKRGKPGYEARIFEPHDTKGKVAIGQTIAEFTGVATGWGDNPRRSIDEIIYLLSGLEDRTGMGYDEFSATVQNATRAGIAVEDIVRGIEESTRPDTSSTQEAGEPPSAVGGKPTHSEETPSDQVLDQSDQVLDQKASETPPALTIEALGSDSIIIKGDIYTHKDKLKAVGARFNPYKGGWVAPREKEPEIREALKDLLGASAPQTPAPAAEPPLTIEALDSDKIIVKGNTYTHKDRIKALGGRWNPYRKGWELPREREEKAREELADLLGASAPLESSSAKPTLPPQAETSDESNEERTLIKRYGLPEDTAFFNDEGRGPAKGKWVARGGGQKSNFQETKELAAQELVDFLEMARQREKSDREMDAFIEKAKSPEGITRDDAKQISKYGNGKASTDPIDGILVEMGLTVTRARKLRNRVGAVGETTRGAVLYDIEEVVNAARRELGIGEKPSQAKPKAKAKPATDAAKLRHIRLINQAEGKRAYGDRRFKVIRETHEYRDEAGHEYRKSFEYKAGQTPTIPESGTHEELNALKEQWHREAQQEEISAQLKAKAAREAEFQANALYTRLMEAKAKDVPDLVAGLSEADARDVLTRLDAAPGDNPAVRKAINARLLAKPTDSGDAHTQKLSRVARLILKLVPRFNEIGMLYGDANAEVRAAILSAIKGQKVPKSRAGITELERAVMELFGITGNTGAERRDNLEEAVKRYGAEPKYSRAQSPAILEEGVTYDQATLSDAHGKPYLQVSEGRDRSYLYGYPITRDEADALRAADADIFRIETKGPETTGEQGWFLRSDVWSSDPGVDYRTGQKRPKFDPETQALIKRIKERDRLAFHWNIGLNEKPQLHIQLWEQGDGSTPANLYSRAPESGELTPELHRFASALGALIDETGISDTVEALEHASPDVIAEVDEAARELVGVGGTDIRYSREGNIHTLPVWLKKSRAELQRELENIKRALGKAQSRYERASTELDLDHATPASKRRAEEEVTLARNWVETLKEKLDEVESWLRPPDSKVLEFSKKPGIRYSRAWHGGPHDHEQFRLDKIGTGQGVQMYGWGLYFADEQEVADWHRRQLSYPEYLYDGEPMNEDEILARVQAEFPEANAHELRGVLIGYHYGDSVEDALRHSDHRTDARQAAHWPAAERKATRTAVRHMLEGIERYRPEEGYVRLVPKGGQRVLKSLSREEQSLFYDMAGDLHWYRHREDPLVPVREMLEGTVKAQTENIAYVKEQDYQAEQIATAVARSEKLIKEAKAKLALLDKYEIRADKDSRRGRLYEVELAPEVEEYLDWDKPISEQSQTVRDLLAKHRVAHPEAHSNQQGMHIYRQVVKDKGSPEAASRYLASIGIPGIRYLDGNSRGKGEGSYNYVLFRDDLIEIKSKFSRTRKIDRLTDQLASAIENLFIKAGTTELSKALRSRKVSAEDKQEYRKAQKALELYIMSGRAAHADKIARGMAARRSNSGGRKAASGEGIPDSALSNAKFLTDLLESEPFRSQGLRSLKVPRQRMVLAQVRALLKNDEVREAVIKLIPVEVVDALRAKKLTPEMLLHDEAMLGDLLIVDGEASIPIGIDVADALIRAVAREAAKVNSVALVEGRFPANSSPAPSAGDGGTQVPAIGITAGGTAEGTPTALDGSGTPVKQGVTEATIDNRHGIPPNQDTVLGEGGGREPPSSPSPSIPQETPADAGVSALGGAKVFNPFANLPPLRASHLFTDPETAKGQVEAILRSSRWGKFFGRLIAAKKLRIVGSTSELPADARKSGVRGVTIGDVSWLNAEELAKLPDSRKVAIALHEILHGNLHEFIGEKRWQQLLRRLDAILGGDKTKSLSERLEDAILKPNTELGRFFQAALESIPAKTPEADMLEELAGYSIEMYLAHAESKRTPSSRVEQRVEGFYQATTPLPLPKAILAWVRDLIRAVKVALFRRFGVFASSLTEADIAALTIKALKRRARELTPPEGPRGGRVRLKDRETGLTTAYVQGLPNLNRRSEQPGTFYSQLRKVVNDLMGKQEPAGQLRLKLAGWVKAGKIKADEVDWSGLTDFLSLAPGKVSKADVLAFLDANGVQVVDVEPKGEKRLHEDLNWDEGRTVDPDRNYVEELAEDYLDEARDELHDDYTYENEEGEWEVDEDALERAASDRAWARAWEHANEWAETEYRDHEHGYSIFYNPNDQEYTLVSPQGDHIPPQNDRTSFHTFEDAQDAAEQHALANLGAATTEYQYEQYQVPGGENYKELLLVLPEKESTGWLSKTDRRDLSALTEVERKRWHELSGLASDGNLDGGEKVEWDRLIEKTKRIGPPFTSSHYDVPNILAHVRFTERTDAEGKKTLFLEEIQSDWHQQGRKKGYGAVKVEANTGQYAENRPWRVGETLFASRENAEEEAARLSRERVPDAPFKNNAWMSLALKRMIRYAAEHGFDRVAWTTGEQQAARYNLSRHIDAIHWGRMSDGSYRIHGIRGGNIVIEKTGLTDGELDELVGQEIADKIRAGEGRESDSAAYMKQFRAIKAVEAGALEGVDLEVGGEGMRAFYDVMLPNIANDVLKKFGGGRVSTTTLDIPGSGPRERMEYRGPEPTPLEVQRAAQDDANSDLVQRQLRIVADAMSQGESFRSTIERWGSPNTARALGGDMVMVKNTVPTPVPSFDITPSLKASAMRGFPLFSYAGRKAKVADYRRQAEAIEQEQAGVPMEEIRRTTGWFRGLDKKWKFEIDDSGSRIRPKYEDAKTVGEAIDHPALFAAYPALAKIPLELVPMGSNLGGRFDSEQGTIFINSLRSSWDVKRILLHELQHVIQAIEGFARGGSWKSKEMLEEARRLKINPRSAKAMIKLYRHLGGEIEARSVEHRMDFSEEERREFQPFYTEEQRSYEPIIRFSSPGGIEASDEGSGIKYSMASNAADLVGRLDRRMAAHTVIRTRDQQEHFLRTGEFPKEASWVNRKLQAFREALVDYQLPFKSWLDSHGHTDKAWKELKLVPGKLKNLSDQFDRAHLRALREQVREVAKKYGISPEQAVEYLGQWATLRHVPEANARLRDNLERAWDEQVDVVMADIKTFDNAMDGEPDFDRYYALTREAREALKRSDPKALKSIVDKINRILRNRLEGARVRPKPSKAFKAAAALSHFDATQRGEGGDRAKLAGGRTDTEALELMRIAERKISRTDLERFGDAVVAAFDDLKAQAIRSGYISPQQAETLPDFEYYVALTGDPLDTMGTDIFGSGMNDTKILSRKGRESVPDNAFIALLERAGRTLTYEATQDFKKELDELYRQAEEEVRAELGEDAKKAGAVKKAIYEKIGLAKSPKTKMTLFQDISKSVLWRDPEGKEWLFRFDDPKVAEALHKENIEHIDNAILRGMSAITRAFARTVTHFVPIFGPINSFRDIQEKSILIRSRGVVDRNGNALNPNELTRKVWGHYLDFNTLRAAYRAAFDLENLGVDAAGQSAKRLIDLGGLSTFGQHLARSRQDSLAEIKRLFGLRKLPGQAADFMTNYNSAFEVASSFATFRALEEMGVDSQEAAYQTLQLMNFGQKGAHTGFLRALYVFFNPAVQSGSNLIGQLQTKRGSMDFIMLTLLGIGLYALAKATGDDDDELGNEIDQRGTYEVERNLVFKVADGTFGKIPVGFGLPQFAQTLGGALMRWFSGRYSGADVVTQTSKSLGRQFLPVGYSEVPVLEAPFSWLVKTLTPTLGRPIMDIATDTNAFGTSLTPWYPNPNKFHSEQGRVRTEEAYKGMAEWLRENLGIDPYPEQVKALAEGYVVGPFGEMLRAIHQDDQVEKGEKTEPYAAVPLAGMLGAGRFVAGERHYLETKYYDTVIEEGAELNRKHKNREPLTPVERKKLGIYRMLGQAVQQANERRNKIFASARDRNIPLSAVTDRLTKLQAQKDRLMREALRRWQAVE
jgi:GGDEF domain-containing protein